MITVPLAGWLPSHPRPVSRVNASMTSGGKPSGYVGNACVSTIPIISQWPVVVSLPALASAFLPHEARGASTGGTPRTSVMLPSPIEPSTGIESPPTTRAVLPSVFDPTSP